MRRQVEGAAECERISEAEGPINIDAEHAPALQMATLRSETIPVVGFTFRARESIGFVSPSRHSFREAPYRTRRSSDRARLDNVCAGL